MSAVGAVVNGPALPRSAPRQRWVFAPQHPEEAAALAKAAHVPAVIAELLLAAE